MTSRRPVERALLIAFVMTGVLQAASACKSSEPVPAEPQAVQVSLPHQGIDYGNEDALVTVVEFGSFACSVCERFMKEIFPGLDSAFFRSGRARYRYVDISPNGKFAYAAAIHRCTLSELGFVRGRRWVIDSALHAPNFDEMIDSTSAMVHLSPTVLRECVSRILTSKARAQERKASDVLGVKYTPTFLVGRDNKNGDVVGWAYIGIDRPDSIFTLITAAEKLLKAR